MPEAIVQQLNTEVIKGQKNGAESLKIQPFWFGCYCGKCGRIQ